MTVKGIGEKICIRTKPKFPGNGNGSILGFSSEGSHLIKDAEKETELGK